MKNSLLHGSTKPSSQEGSNGDFYIQVLEDDRVLWGPKRNGSWDQSFSFSIPEPKDGKDGVSVVEAGDNVAVTGEGTPEKPYKVHTKNEDYVVSGEISEDSGTLILKRLLGTEVSIDISQIVSLIEGVRSYSEKVNNKPSFYFINETLVPIGLPVSRLSKNIGGLSTANYLVVPRNSRISDITWRYLSDTPNPIKGWVDPKPFHPAPFRAEVTLDVWANGEKVAEGLEPDTPYKVKSIHNVAPGTIIYFDVNVSKGDPHGLSVSVGMEDLKNTKFKEV